jgi:chemotaxis protein CheX
VAVKHQADESRAPGAGAQTAGLDENLSVLSELLRDSCMELMEGYGLDAELQNPSARTDPPTPVLIAAIDFSGKNMRGTVALRATRSVVIETFRAATKAAADASNLESADWTCELVNQLIGRMKNKLRAYDVSFTVNVPRLIGAVPADELENALRNRFVCDSGTFAGYLDVLISPGFVFRGSVPPAPLPEEGELVMF